MASDIQERVDHAMKSWAKAIHSDISGDSTVKMRRFELLDSVLSSEEKDKDSFVRYVRPHDYEDFLSRVWTYKSSTWFAKPNVISATNCARFGWINQSSNCLLCPSCNSTLTHETQDINGESLKKQLRSGHNSICFWGQPGFSSPISFLSPPHMECMESALKSFSDRLRKNWKRFVDHTQDLTCFTWSMLDESLAVKNSDKICHLNVTELFTGGKRFRNEDALGDSGCYEMNAEILGQYLLDQFSTPRNYIFEHGNIPPNPHFKAEGDTLMQALRGTCDINSGMAHVLLAYIIAVESSLFGLETDVKTVKIDETISTTLELSCQICCMKSKYDSSSAKPLEFFRCHRNFCPYVTGYRLTLDEERDMEDTKSANNEETPQLVPAGWILNLESVLVAALGVPKTEYLLGTNNMHYCHPVNEKASLQNSVDRMKSSLKRPLFNALRSSGSGIAASTSGTNALHPLSESSRIVIRDAGAFGQSSDDKIDGEPPYDVYKKIKCILKS